MSQTYEDDKDDANKSPVMKELEKKWQDEYTKIGDVELRKIIDQADSIKETEPYILTDKVQAFWKPISNKQDKEYRAKRRVWEAKTRQLAEAKYQKDTDDEQKEKDMLDLEEMVDNYYAGLLQLFFDLERQVYDNLPPSVTSLAVEAALHHLRHPLSPNQPQSKGGSQPKSVVSSPPKIASGSTGG